MHNILPFWAFLSLYRVLESLEHFSQTVERKKLLYENILLL